MIKELLNRFDVVFEYFLVQYQIGQVDFSPVISALLFVSQMGIIDSDKYFECSRRLSDISFRISQGGDFIN